MLSLAFALLLAAVNLVAWHWANPGQPAAHVNLPVTGLAYNGFQRWQDPVERSYPSPRDLQEDLSRLAQMTRRLRSYSTAEAPSLPRLAETHGLKLAAGAWLSDDDRQNGREIEALLQAAQSSPAIDRVIAGNETQLHGALVREELLRVLDLLRARLKVPVSTAEPWHIWLNDPELVQRVDYIAVHLLPYWEGVPAAVAVHEVWRRYEELRARYPGKPIVIAEVGWPSAGASIERRHHGVLNQASASPLEQARFLREFVASAQHRAEPVEYYLMEAVDQPWKLATEGAAGPHWGVLDAHRQPKFNWVGPLEHNPYWLGQALASALLGLLVAWPILHRFHRMRLMGRLAFGLSVQAVATLAVTLVTQPLVVYLRLIDVLLLALLVPALMLMAAIILSQTLEFAELYWEGSLQRRSSGRPWPQGSGRKPRISVHLACSNEPPEMVIESIRSLQALRWPELEIIVVDNNTRSEADWQPVRDTIEAQRAAGDVRLRFIHLPHWPGFKAGALNVALAATDPQAQWVAVVDADYVVDPEWLNRVAGHLADDDVAVVQAPQAHRDAEAGRLARMMNWEYEGFFRLGMHHRHERNAIVQHGTMTLVRASALQAVGGWAENCKCEDTELGVRLLRAGWRQVYVDEVLGSGLLPRDFAAYRRQRLRWAEGGLQILRRHAGALWSRTGGLSLDQRYHFIAGWLPWIGDLLHLVFTLTAAAWTMGVVLLPQHFDWPTPLLVAPLVAFLGTRLVLVPLLYRRRVCRSWADIGGAALAGMALSHAIARGVLAGLLGRRNRFEITRKGRRGQTSATSADGAARPSEPQRRWWSAASEEGLLLLLLGMSATLVAWMEAPWTAGRGAWLVLLGLQSLPYLAAVICARLSAWESPPFHRGPAKKMRAST